MSERLTRKSKHEKGGYVIGSYIYCANEMRTVVDELAEYENIRYDASGNEVISLDRLRELATAEKEGCEYVCLESQERELSRITGELERFRAFHERYAEQTSKKYVEEICALTARAEQAEAREKAMIDYLRGYCQFCEHDDCMEEEPPCCDCENVTHDGRECKWELRRKPQEGEKE